MSLRDLIRKETLRLRLAATEAKAGGLTRGSLLGGMGGLGLRGNLGSRLLAPRGAEPPMQGQPEPPMANFQPKTPILGIFLQGSRPIRETLSSLILSTQQPQEQENPTLNPEIHEPKIDNCPMCHAQVLESFEYCPSCAHILKASTGQESKTLSVQA